MLHLLLFLSTRWWDRFFFVFYKTPASWSPTRTSCLYRRRVCVDPGKPAAFQYLYSRTATHLGNGGSGRGETFPPFYLLPSSYIDTLCECVCCFSLCCPPFRLCTWWKRKKSHVAITHKKVYTIHNAVDVGEGYQQTVDAGPGKQSLRAWKKVHNTPTQRERVSAGGLLLCVFRHIITKPITQKLKKKNIRFFPLWFLII